MPLSVCASNPLSLCYPSFSAQDKYNLCLSCADSERERERERERDLVMKLPIESKHACVFSFSQQRSVSHSRGCFVFLRFSAAAFRRTLARCFVCQKRRRKKGCLSTHCAERMTLPDSYQLQSKPAERPLRVAQESGAAIHQSAASRMLRGGKLIL